MIQSMVSAMVAQNPAARPKDVVIPLNRALFENVRHRLHRDEHATLTIVRANIDGELTFAGCHEDFFIYRVATGLCQQVPTPGFWVDHRSIACSERTRDRFLGDGMTLRSPAAAPAP